MHLPLAGFTSARKMLQMSYQACPARRKENTPSPEMGNTAASFPAGFGYIGAFLFYFLSHSSFPTMAGEAGTNRDFNAAEF